MSLIEQPGGALGPSPDLLSIVLGILRGWKWLITIPLLTMIAIWGGLKIVPSSYKSTAEILIVDPERQIDGAIQKPISPFIDAVNNEAMNTEINVVRSKSVALRVAKELGLDKDPEFQPHGLFSELAERLGLVRSRRADTGTEAEANGAREQEQAEKLDEAAEALRGKLQVERVPFSYVLTVSATSEDPVKAQRLASTIANDYLASQREARQDALQRVAIWLKGRVDDLQSRVLETESSIEKLKAESGISDTGFNNVTEQQIGELNTQLITARAEVAEKRARLEQAHRVIDTNGDIQSIPELTASTALMQLRQQEADLNWRAADLQSKLGDRHFQVTSIRAELAGIKRQISGEAEHILGNMKNAFDVAVRREQSLEESLQRLTAARGNSETYVRLQQLRRVADADRKLYESYLSQYNEISQRRTLQDASARIISPATLPKSPSSPRRIQYYALGGMFGLGVGLLLAFLLEYLKPGIKTGTEIEQSFGHPVIGMIPLVERKKSRSIAYNRLLHRIVDEPLSHFSEAVHAIRISLEISNSSPKVVLITSSLPAEGKSTAAMLLAASSASSGRRTVLLDCDLRQQSTSEAFRNKHQPGLSELLLGKAELMDVISKDPATKINLVPAGSGVPNAADLLMSQRMRDLVAELRAEFDYIVMDTAPLLPVVDALGLATIADKVLVIVEWSHTPRGSISEALKILRPEAHRVAGIVLTKVDIKQLQGYSYPGGDYYRSGRKYFTNA